MNNMNSITNDDNFDHICFQLASIIASNGVTSKLSDDIMNLADTYYQKAMRTNDKRDWYTMGLYEGLSAIVEYVYYETM